MNDKIVSIEGGKKEEDEELYINPDAMEAIEGLADWISQIGVRDIQIVIVSGCGEHTEVFETYDRNDLMFGAINKYRDAYSLDLREEYDDE